MVNSNQAIVLVTFAVIGSALATYFALSGNDEVGENGSFFFEGSRSATSSMRMVVDADHNTKFEFYDVAEDGSFTIKRNAANGGRWTYVSKANQWVCHYTAAAASSETLTASASDVVQEISNLDHTSDEDQYIMLQFPAVDGAVPFPLVFNKGSLKAFAGYTRTNFGKPELFAPFRDDIPEQPADESSCIQKSTDVDDSGSEAATPLAVNPELETKPVPESHTADEPYGMHLTGKDFDLQHSGQTKYSCSINKSYMLTILMEKVYSTGTSSFYYTGCYKSGYGYTTCNSFDVKSNGDKAMQCSGGILLTYKYLFYSGSDSLNDWFNNFRAYTTSYYGASVHSGFATEANQFNTWTNSRVTAVSTSTRVYFCGHSLGGAIGMLQAYRTSRAYGRISYTYIVSMGTPTPFYYRSQSDNYLYTSRFKRLENFEWDCDLFFDDCKYDPVPYVSEIVGYEWQGTNRNSQQVDQRRKNGDCSSDVEYDWSHNNCGTINVWDLFDASIGCHGAARYKEGAEHLNHYIA